MSLWVCHWSRVNFQLITQHNLFKLQLQQTQDLLSCSTRCYRHLLRGYKTVNCVVPSLFFSFWLPRTQWWIFMQVWTFKRFVLYMLVLHRCVSTSTWYSWPAIPCKEISYQNVTIFWKETAPWGKTWNVLEYRVSDVVWKWIAQDSKFFSCVYLSTILPINAY